MDNETFSIYFMIDHTGEAYDYEVVMLIDDDFDHGRYTLERGYPYETDEECEAAAKAAMEKWQEKFGDHIWAFVREMEPSGAATQA